MYNVQMRSKGSAQQLEQRRRLAVQRVNEGWKQKDVAAFLGVGQRTVGRWVAAYRSAGDDGLLAKPSPGRRPFLTPDQEQQVLAWLLKKPTEFGFPTDLWTARRVARLIQDRFGVAFHPNYLREWLAKRRLSPQKPAERARERDGAAIDRWVGHDWPALQKKRRKSRRTSS